MTYVLQDNATAHLYFVTAENGSSKTLDRAVMFETREEAEGWKYIQTTDQVIDIEQARILAQLDAL